LFGVGVLALVAYSYQDINAANNQLLVEIRKQNSDLKRLLSSTSALNGGGLKKELTGTVGEKWTHVNVYGHVFCVNIFMHENYSNLPITNGWTLSQIHALSYSGMRPGSGLLAHCLPLGLKSHMYAC
jgi:hypothetical protein